MIERISVEYATTLHAEYIRNCSTCLLFRKQPLQKFIFNTNVKAHSFCVSSEGKGLFDYMILHRPTGLYSDGGSRKKSFNPARRQFTISNNIHIAAITVTYITEMNYIIATIRISGLN